MRDSSQEELSLLLNGLQVKVNRHVENIFNLLSFIYDPGAIKRAWKVFQESNQAGEEVRSYALETIDVMVAKDLKAILMPLIDSQTPAEQLSRLKPVFPQKSMTTAQRLLALLEGPSGWLQLCALYSVGRSGLTDKAIEKQMIKMALDDSASSLVREMAVWALACQPVGTVERMIASADKPVAAEVERLVNSRRLDNDLSLSIMAKVDILHQITFFARTPDEVLLDVAAELTETCVEAGEPVFAKGEDGDSMFIVAAGRIRIHDGAHTFNHQDAGDVFGEMALLESQPRSASATAVGPTRLLRLDRDPFNELMAEHPPINYGIIRVLSRYLRTSVEKLAGGSKATSTDTSITTSYAPDEDNVLLAPELAPVERMMLLTRVNLFSRLPVDVLSELVFLMREVRLAQGDTVFEEGTPGDALYIIARGKVEVLAGNRTLNFLQEGQIFGEMALLGSEPRLATVTAVEHTRLLRIDQAPFYELLEDRIELAEGIIQNLTGHLRDRVNDLTEVQAY
jgi:CRP-like cAMP-binding protein